MRRRVIVGDDRDPVGQPLGFVSRCFVGRSLRRQFVFLVLFGLEPRDILFLGGLQFVVFLDGAAVGLLAVSA